MGRKINIFMIYTLADKDIMLHLLRHLNPLNEAFNLSIWHDDPIIHGQAWKTYFESRIFHTDIFLLLVSDDFMNSQFINQVEYRAIIHRHRENKSVVIPVILNKCQWDIDLKVKDNEFNLNELWILPEDGRPISDWDSVDQAYNNVVAGIKKAITPIVDTLHQEESEKDEEMKVGDVKEEDLKKINYTEESEVDKLDDAGLSYEEEITTADEEHRLWEEAEAKRRAEVAKRILEEAEASARRREEEDRLWEEALTKRRAEKDKRISEAASESVYSEAEENRILEEAEAKKRAEKEKKKKRKQEEEESRRNAEEASKAASILRAEQEKLHKEEVKVKRYAEEQKIMKLTFETNEKVKETLPKKNTKIKKRMLGGSLVALLTIIVIWALSIVNSGSEKPSTPLPNSKTKDENDSIVSAKTKIDSLNKVTAFSELKVGDTFEGGIIFTIDRAGKTGKIAHPKDAGPMPWTNAMRIHEQLGEGWRLPSFEELEIMYKTIGQGATNSGQFADELYWSATAFDEYQARLLRFRDGNTSYHYNSNVEHRKFWARAVRDFSQ